MASKEAQLNTALTRLRQHTGQDYTLAYNRTLTRYWLRLDGQTISPELTRGDLIAWIAQYSEKMEHYNEPVLLFWTD